MDTGQIRSQRQWEPYKSILRYLFLVQKLSLQEVVSYLQAQGVQTSENQVGLQLKRWKFQKYFDKNAIAYLNDRVTRRAQDGFCTDIFLSGIQMAPKSWQRRISRPVLSIFETLNAPPRPKTPQNLDLSISTPAPLPMQFDSWPENLPWLRSQPSISIISNAIASVAIERSVLTGSDFVNSALSISSSWKSTVPNLKFAENLSIAAAAIGKIMPESFGGQNFIRAKVLLNHEIDHEAITEAIKVTLFRLSNNLDTLEDMAILDLFRADVILSRIPHKATISMQDPTVAAIIDKLLIKALSDGDSGISTINALLELRVNMNHPVTVNKVYQMPLQAAIRQGASKLTKVLIHAGSDINTTFGNQPPLLVQAAKHYGFRALSLCEMLLSTHRLANKNAQLNSALLTAATNCDIDLVKFLIQQGASVNHCVNAESATPLSKHTVLVKALYGPTFSYKGYLTPDWLNYRGKLENNKARTQLVAYLLEHRLEDTHLPSTIPIARITPDALIAACLRENISAIELLHTHGADVNSCNDKEVSPLSAAVYGAYDKDSITSSDRYPILKFLFQCGAKINEPTNKNWGNQPSLLHIAAMVGCKSTITLLLEHGMNVNHPISLQDYGDRIISKGYYNFIPDFIHSEPHFAKTALQVALCMRNSQCLFCLLEHKAEATIIDLIKAVQSGNPELVKAILAGGNIDKRDENWESVRQEAFKGKCNTIIELITGEPSLNNCLIEAYLNGSVNWRFKTHWGASILELAVLKGDKALLDLVFRKIPRAYDPGALCAAVLQIDWEQLDLSVIEALLRNRGQSKWSNLVEGTAIASAAINGYLTCVNLLLDYIPVTKYCRLPYDSKHSALSDDGPIQFGIEYDGKIDREEAELKAFWHNDKNIRASPLFAAVRGENVEIIYKMLKVGFIPDKLTLLAAIMSPEVAEGKVVIAMMQHYECIRGGNSSLITPLQAAVAEGRTELVELLLRKGADVNAQPGGLWDCGGWNRLPGTALQVAVGNGDLSLIKILLDAGARINAKAAPDNGATALQLAAMYGYLGIVKILLDKGANINAHRCRYNGRTALEGAAENGGLDIIQLLLSHGVKIEGKGRRQYIRATKFARMQGHHAVERLLMEQRSWSSKEIEMLENEDLNKEDTYDPEEWSDEKEMNNYLKDSGEPFDIKIDETKDEMSDEEMADEEVADEEVADEEVADEEVADEEVADEEVADEEMSNEKTDNQMIDDKGVRGEEVDEEVRVIHEDPQVPCHQKAENSVEDEGQNTWPDILNDFVDLEAGNGSSS